MRRFNIIISIIALIAISGLLIAGIIFYNKDDGGGGDGVSLSITLSVSNKVYDGLPISVTSTAIQGANITTEYKLTGTDSYFTEAPKNAGNYVVRVTASKDGTTEYKSESFSITPKQLTVNNVTASNKQYDGTTAALIDSTAASLSGVVGGDSVSLTGSISGTFSQKGVGSGLTVSVSGASLTGVDSGNYTLASLQLIANITPKLLTVGGFTVLPKFEDLNTSANIMGTAVIKTEIINGDTVAISGTPVATFAQAAVGINIPVTISGISLIGIDAFNYSIAPMNLTSNIYAEGSSGQWRYVYYPVIEGGSITGNTNQLVANNGSGTTVTAVAAPGYSFIGWSDGLKLAQRLDTNVQNDDILFAIFEPKTQADAFDFINEVSDSKIDSSASIDSNGYIVTMPGQQISDAVILDEPLILNKAANWTLASEFSFTDLGSFNNFTLLGCTQDYGDGTKVFAWQLTQTSLRICMLNNTANYDTYHPLTFSLGNALQFDTKYRITVTSVNEFDISGYKLFVTIIELDTSNVVVNNQMIYYNTAHTYVLNCNVIGNTFFQGGAVGGAGTIYSVRIYGESDVVEPQPNEGDFDFVNQMSSVRIASANNVDPSGFIVSGASDTKDDVTKLSAPLKLSKNEKWTLSMEFSIMQGSPLARSTPYTLFGSDETYGNGAKIYAMQLAGDELRICMMDNTNHDEYIALNFYENYNSGQLKNNARYQFTLQSLGNLTIDGYELVVTIIEIAAGGTEIIAVNAETIYSTAGYEYALNSNVIGNSFYGDSNMNSVGIIYYVHITKDDSASDSMNFDLFIIAGQSNSVGYTWTGASTLDPSSQQDFPNNIYEYRPSINNIQTFRKTVGEGVSAANDGTWFSSMAKEYSEQTGGRNIVILPAGHAGVPTSYYYNGGESFSTLMGKYNNFINWLNGTDNVLERVILVWHQGESDTGDGIRTIDKATEKVFDDIKAAITVASPSHLLTQAFFSRIAISETGANVKEINQKFLDLNANTDYVLVAPNAMKYYWLDAFSDEHHYDMYACNDLGKEIGNHVAYYFNTGNKPYDPNNLSDSITRPYDVYQGEEEIIGFSGIRVINNNLIRFSDTVDEDLFWYCGASDNGGNPSFGYNSFAGIETVTLSDSDDYELTFTAKLGDNIAGKINVVAGNYYPVLGSSDGASSIEIASNGIRIVSAAGTVVLNHNSNPMIARKTYSTKPYNNYTYKIVQNGGTIQLFVKATQDAGFVLVDTQTVPTGMFLELDQLMRNGSSTYMQGVVANMNLTFA